MMTTVTATYAKNNLGELIDRVVVTRKKILIKRAGRPAVFVTPVVNDFELKLTDKEIEGIEKGMKEFRKSFKMDFDRW